MNFTSLNFKFYKPSIFKIQVFSLVSSTFTGASLYFGVQQLQFVRIFIVISLFYAIYVWTMNKIKFPLMLTLYSGFFYFDFIWETGVALSTNSLDYKSLFNGIFLVLLIFSLAILGSFRSKLFTKTVYQASLFMFFVMMLIAAWEVATGLHLPNSSINVEGNYLGNIPTAFFTNQNDFMAMMTLIYLLVCNYHYAHGLNKKKIEIVVFILIILLGFLTASRTNLVVSLFIFIIFSLRNFKNTINLTALIIPLVVIALYFNLNFIISLLTNYNFDVDMLLQGLNLLNADDQVRINLYIEGFNSIYFNYGAGYGIDNSTKYYSSINGSQLSGITNPHNYLLEILINGGIYMFSIYLTIIILLMFMFFKSKKYYFFISIILYFQILLSSSSSLYLFYHYVLLVNVILYFYHMKASDVLSKRNGLAIKNL